MANIFEELMQSHMALTESIDSRKKPRCNCKKFSSKRFKVESLKIFEGADFDELDADFAVDPEETSENKDEVVLIIDPELPTDEEVPEDAAENLVGDFVYKCPICGANYVCDPNSESEYVSLDENGVPTECPVCGEDTDQILVGEIAPAEEVEGDEERELEPQEVEEEEESEEDFGEEDFDFEEEEEVLEDSLKPRRRVTEAKIPYDTVSPSDKDEFLTKMSAGNTLFKSPKINKKSFVGQIEDTKINRKDGFYEVYLTNKKDPIKIPMDSSKDYYVVSKSLSGKLQKMYKDDSGTKAREDEDEKKRQEREKKLEPQREKERKEKERKEREEEERDRERKYNSQKKNQEIADRKASDKAYGAAGKNTDDKRSDGQKNPWWKMNKEALHEDLEEDDVDIDVEADDFPNEFQVQDEVAVDDSGAKVKIDAETVNVNLGEGKKSKACKGKDCKEDETCEEACEKESKLSNRKLRRPITKTEGTRKPTAKVSPSRINRTRAIQEAKKASVSRKTSSKSNRPFTFKEDKFESMMNRMIRENYKTKDSFKVNRVQIVDGKLTLNYSVGKRNGTFVAEGFDKNASRMKLRIKDKGVFTESYTKTPSFILECVCVNKSVIPTKIRYNFTKRINESLYRVRGDVK